MTKDKPLKTLKERRDELARRYYGVPYASCCWRRQEAVDSALERNTDKVKDRRIGE